MFVVLGFVAEFVVEFVVKFVVEFVVEWRSMAFGMFVEQEGEHSEFGNALVGFPLTFDAELRPVELALDLVELKIVTWVNCRVRQGYGVGTIVVYHSGTTSDHYFFDNRSQWCQKKVK